MLLPTLIPGGEILRWREDQRLPKGSGLWQLLAAKILKGPRVTWVIIYRLSLVTLLIGVLTVAVPFYSLQVAFFCLSCVLQKG